MQTFAKNWKIYPKIRTIIVSNGLNELCILQERSYVVYKAVSGMRMIQVLG